MMLIFFLIIGEYEFLMKIIVMILICKPVKLINFCKLKISRVKKYLIIMYSVNSEHFTKSIYQENAVSL